MKQISVVIVSYRIKYVLEQTLLSTILALKDFDYEIFVIDNHSQDDSINYLKSRFPTVSFIENQENTGFAKANNQGFRMASGTYTLILNPDTIISRRTILDCLDWEKTHPDCGGIGVQMHDGDGNFLPESKRAFPTPWVSFCKIFGLSTLFPYSRFFARYHLRYLDYDKPHKVDILAGAFIFIRTSILKQCHGFDEDFFMYGEDIDLSYRIAQADYSNYYIPTPIIHYKGECTKKGSLQYVKVFYEAMWIFFKKHYPNYSRIYYFFIRLAVFLRASIAMLRRIVPLHRLTEKKRKPTQKLVILSQFPDEIESLLPAGQYTSIQAIPNLDANDGKIPSAVDIIIDNRLSDYGRIIDYIVQMSHPKRKFSIYLSQAGQIITPKNQ